MLAARRTASGGASVERTMSRSSAGYNVNRRSPNPLKRGESVSPRTHFARSGHSSSFHYVQDDEVQHI